MKCPYCTSEISDEALACPRCTRDFYLFKPLLAKIGTLEAAVAELEGRLQAMAPAGGGDIAPAAPEPDPTAPELLRQGALCWIAPLILLLVAHALITVAYDLNTLYLRIVSLLIPLPFGYLALRRGPRSVPLWLFGAFAMAASAVLGMSGLTAHVDHTAVLPQDRREWKEFIEYAASVGFSFVTGMVLGRMVWRSRQMERQALQASELAVRLAKMVSTGKESADKIQGLVKKINELRGSLTAAATSAASAYIGLKEFIGGG